MVPRGNTLNRLDLSDLCFVDDLVSLLIFWRKSQLSRFAEMVSQVLESGRLRVNKSKLVAPIGAAGPGARRINAEIARGACQFTFRGETIRATTVVKDLGFQVESQGSTRAGGADEGYQGHQGPGSIFSWTVGSSFYWLSAQKISLWLTLHTAFRCMQQKLMRSRLQDPLFMCLDARPPKRGLEYTQ